MIKKLICMSLFFSLILVMISPFTAKADIKLDEIEEYKITVDIESDGSMDIAYHIDWKVLDDSSEGPLKWVKIGIPNPYADNIKALSGNISDIYYYSGGGDYVRIDLGRSYKAGEIVTLDFSLRQSNMYTLDPGNNLCSYEFTPGWFDEIDVKSMIVLWNNENVLDSNAQGAEGNYLKWTTSLAAGERYNVTVNYSIDAFDTSGYIGNDINSYPTYDPGYGQTGEDIGYTYDDNDYDSGDSGTGIIIIVPVLFIIIVIVARIIGGGGGYDGGFGTRGGYHGGYLGGGHCACASSCACACAGCACACACAGGGRAGCSAKNFYGPAAQIDGLKRVLQQNLKSTKKRAKR